MGAWTPILMSHVFASLTAVLLGIVVLVRRKGDASHRAVGRVWVVLMYWAALSSFFVRELRDGAFSGLHILSVVTLVTVTLGLVSIRRGKLRSHRGNMIGSWLGSVGAMIFALAIPVRAIPTFIVTEPLGAATALATIVATVIAVVFAGDRIALATQHHASSTDHEAAS